MGDSLPPEATIILNSSIITKVTLVRNQGLQTTMLQHRERELHSIRTYNGAENSYEDLIVDYEVIYNLFSKDLMKHRAQECLKVFSMFAF